MAILLMGMDAHLNVRLNVAGLALIILRNPVNAFKNAIKNTNQMRECMHAQMVINITGMDVTIFAKLKEDGSARREMDRDLINAVKYVEMVIIMVSNNAMMETLIIL